MTLVVAAGWFSTLSSFFPLYFVILLKGIEPIIAVECEGCCVRRNHLHEMEPSSLQEMLLIKRSLGGTAPVLPSSVPRTYKKGRWYLLSVQTCLPGL